MHTHRTVLHGSLVAAVCDNMAQIEQRTLTKQCVSADAAVAMAAALNVTEPCSTGDFCCEAAYCQSVALPRSQERHCRL